MAIIARFFNRKAAPKATNNLSLFARAKAAVVKAVSHVVSFVKTQARKVVASVSAVAERVKPVAKRAWVVALRPFLGGVLAGAALGVVIVGVAVAPATTVLALVATGGAFILAAKGVKFLEDTQATSAASRIVLRVLEGVAQVLRVLAYAGAAVLAIATCVASPAFAVFSALTLGLAYLDVRGGGTIAFLAWCALSGSWLLGLLWLAWRGASRLSVTDAVVEPVMEYVDVDHVNTEYAYDIDLDVHEEVIAIGAEEVADLDLSFDLGDVDHVSATPPCSACGTTDRGTRVKSNAVPFATGGDNVGTPHAPSMDTLCGDCYDAECEDNAIALTGVSLRKRSVNVALNALGRVNLPEYAMSKDDTTQAFWAVTAWWRDRRGHHHDRQWDCLYDGDVVASVTYDHNRKVYRASALGKFLSTKTSLAVAQRLAVDAFNDELTKGYGAPDPRPNSPQHAVELGLIAGGAR